MVIQREPVPDIRGPGAIFHERRLPVQLALMNRRVALATESLATKRRWQSHARADWDSRIFARHFVGFSRITRGFEHKSVRAAVYAATLEPEIAIVMGENLSGPTSMRSLPALQSRVMRRRLNLATIEPSRHSGKRLRGCNL